MFKCFVENKLISFSQSGFKPVDYCFNQLLSITHEIYSSVDKVIRIFILPFHFNMFSFFLIVTP